jgi:hypothetical protein
VAASIDDNTLRELLRNADSAQELAQLAAYLPQHADLIFDLLIDQRLIDVRLNARRHDRTVPAQAANI